MSTKSRRGRPRKPPQPILLDASELSGNPQQSTITCQGRAISVEWRPPLTPEEMARHTEALERLAKSMGLTVTGPWKSEGARRHALVHAIQRAQARLVRTGQWNAHQKDPT